VVILWMAAVGVVSVVFAYWCLRERPATDFDVIWWGVRHFVHHQDVYTLASPSNLSFVFPPSSLLLLSPLGLLPLTTASQIWVALEFASIIAAAYVSLRLFSIRLNSVIAPTVLLAVAFASPTLEELRMRNVDGIVVLIAVSALFAMSRSKWLAGGILLALALSLKPTAVALLVLPLLYRQWRCVAIAALIPAVLTAGGVLLAKDGLHFFSVSVPYLLHGEGQWNVRDNIAIAGVLRNPLWAPLLRLIVVTLAVASIWKARTSRQLIRTSQLIAIAGLVLVAMHLDFSYSYVRYLLYLLPVLVMLAIYANKAGRIPMLAGVALLLFPFSRVYLERSDSLGIYVSAFDRYRFTVACVLLLASLIVLVWRPRDPGMPVAGAATAS
jgi:hypothetical protein